VHQCMHKHSTTISRNLGLSSKKETQSGKDSCTSCFMHRTRSCAHTLHKDRVRRVKVVVEEAFRGLDRERVLFIGTQFSILYTSMYSPD
jgi:hypothetical protein